MTRSQARKLAEIGHLIADLGLLLCVISWMQLVYPGVLILFVGTMMRVPNMIGIFEEDDPDAHLQ